jgi:uncharacterized protein (TIGR03067 family)
MIAAKLALALLTTTLLAGEDTNKGLPSELIGTWREVSLTVPEGTAPAAAIRNDVTEIKADGTYVQQRDGKVVEKGKIEVEPSKAPKWIDFIITEGRYKGRQPGIYKLEAGTLTLCVPLVGDMQRPARFEAGPGLYVALATLKKETAENKK